MKSELEKLLEQRREIDLKLRELEEWHDFPSFNEQEVRQRNPGNQAHSVLLEGPRRVNPLSLRSKDEIEVFYLVTKNLLSAKKDSIQRQIVEWCKAEIKGQ